MSNTISGSVALAVNLVNQLDVSTTRLAPYPVPVTVTQAAGYSTGTAANQANKIAVLTETASAAPVDVDLTAIACADGTTGFANVRELILINNAATDGMTLTTGNDGVVTNPFVPFAGGTHPTRLVEAGANMRVSKPLGTAGYAVSGAAKTVRVDPGANNVPFVLIVMGN